ncbi:MAG: pilus assembly PilX N-terminal domain-containing protein [Acidobacteriota bacterium]|nr:MAG: pilus assembly PilX N-terminal domain-containing protein [Acidobacteriota bacterium]
MHEKGSALLLAVILSFLLMALGLGLTMSSLSEFTMSDEFESHERALYIADAGIGAVETSMRGRDLERALREETLVPSYLGIPPETERDPISIEEARDIDFNRPPEQVTQFRLTGMLTPSQGVQVGRGRYFARVTDNHDGDSDPLTDYDGRIFIRSVGVHPGPPQEVTLYGSNLKNSVVEIEKLLKRDMSFDASTPFNVYGPHARPSQNRFFDGNAFKIDGYDHSQMSIDEVLRGHHHRDGESEHAAMGMINDDLGGGDATGSLREVYESLDRNQMSNLIGDEGPYGETPSIRDETDMIRESPNGDAKNVFDAHFLNQFINRVAAVADNRYDENTSLSGSNILLGTEDDPQITVAMGDLSLSGNGSGSGILVVKGKLEYSGAFDYNGLILVIGDGEVTISGANKSIIGGLYLAEILQDENGEHLFGIPEFTISGMTNFYFRSKSVHMAISLLPFRSIGWREITREISSPDRMTYPEDPRHAASPNM